MGLAYEDLRKRAVAQLSNERPWCALQPTALVHETCVRLLREHAAFRNSGQFLGASSKVMRRILIDRGRRLRAVKRGRQWRRVDFSAAERIGFENYDDLLDLDAAMTGLEEVDPILSKVVELHFFGGWTFQEIAMILGISECTARRRWADARDWLQKELSGCAHGEVLARRRN
jgi:RNA polymerase sigma factor (TIGR02999 family)